MSLLTVEEMANDYGGIGDHGEDDVQLAIDLAEFDVEDALNSFLVPTTETEEYPWPLLDGKIKLIHQRVTSITTVTAKHSLDSDCVWTEDEECGVILDGINGLIFVTGCSYSLTDCPCNYGNYSYDRVVVTYVSGFTATETASDTSLGKALRMAITLRTRAWLPILEQADDWEGAFLIESWSSMDYSERRNFAPMFSPLGPGPFSQEAWRMLKRIKSVPAIMLRSPNRV